MNQFSFPPLQLRIETKNIHFQFYFLQLDSVDGGGGAATLFPTTERKYLVEVRECESLDSSVIVKQFASFCEQIQYFPNNLSDQEQQLTEKEHLELVKIVEMAFTTAAIYEDHEEFLHLCAVALTTCGTEAVVEAHGGVLDKVMNSRSALLPENASREAVVAINGPGITTPQCSQLLKAALDKYMQEKSGRGWLV